MISEQFSFKIVDIESQAKALRMSWIYRISRNTGWGDVSQKYINDIGGILFYIKVFLRYSVLTENANVLYKYIKVCQRNIFRLKL